MKRCRCKPQGLSVGMCEPPQRMFERGELVEVFFGFPFGEVWVGGYRVQREWIAKRTGQHNIDCRRVDSRIGGHVFPDRVRKLRAGTSWMLPRTPRAPSAPAARSFNESTNRANGSQKEVNDQA